MNLLAFNNKAFKMAESQRGRILRMGVVKLACDVDPSEERPTFTLLIINGAGEGLVSRGRFDAYRRAVAYLMKAGVSAEIKFKFRYSAT